MSAVALPRGEITTYLIAVLRASFDFPVGDNDQPTEPHGWQGEPNEAASVFIPWIAMGSGTSTNSSGSIAASQQDWRTNYFVTTAGIARAQTDQTSDLARKSLVNLARTVITTANGNWKIQQVRVASIGAINKLPQTNPNYFVQTDIIEVWLSKELS